LSERQRQLFDTGGPAAPPPGVVLAHATVAFPRPLRVEFTYAVPDKLLAGLAPGLRVQAPFGKGNRATTGFCIRIEPRRTVQPGTKLLAAILDRDSLLSPAMLELTAWIADEWFCSHGQVLDAVLPRGVKDRSGGRWQIFVEPMPTAADSSNQSSAPIDTDRFAVEEPAIDDPGMDGPADEDHGGEDSVAEYPAEREPFTEQTADAAAEPTSGVPPSAGPASKPAQAESSRLYEVKTSPPGDMAAAEIEAARPALTAKQKRVLELLVELRRAVPTRELANLARCGPEIIKALIEKGYVRATRRMTWLKPDRFEAAEWESPLEVNPAQKVARDRIITAIRERRPTTFLLHGVTGSGKTEVYLQAIDQAVKLGREAIVLVPEISLTPQTIDRFRRRFSHVAVLHSHLTDAERGRHWRSIARGEAQVVVGARSAIFAPCPNLGLIVIDEEHETTFKQESVPRYHAREVAVRRGLIENVPVVLGSATPSLEAWEAALAGRFERLSMPDRVGGLMMPAVRLVDLREEFKQVRSLSALSRPLKQAMYETLDAKGQIILLLNRRGFSSCLLCPICGRTEKCKHCEISLTFHKTMRTLLCHGCDSEFPVPERCPQCGKDAIRQVGFGTQRLEEEVKLRFPTARIERMDSDTMRSATSYETVLSRFRRHEIDILLGTQMIAKGLDFPNVRLVGVVSADTALHLPDFRASERTFQLIAQVAGRTGRGVQAGRVVVQTFEPEDRSLTLAAKHDFLGFAAATLPERQAHGYPPYRRLTRFIVRGPDEKEARDGATRLGERLRKTVAERKTNARLLGPAAAPVARIQDQFRFHLQMQTDRSLALAELLESATRDLELPTGVEFAIDVDPVSLL
jgi:primosomal protein N' (replication factor Y)